MRARDAIYDAMRRRRARVRCACVLSFESAAREGRHRLKGGERRGGGELCAEEEEKRRLG